MSAKPIRIRLRRASDGAPFPVMTAAIRGMDRIDEASRSGKGLYLTAEEARALRWCVTNLQEQGVPENWREVVP